MALKTKMLLSLVPVALITAFIGVTPVFAKTTLTVYWDSLSNIKNLSDILEDTFVPRVEAKLASLGFDVDIEIQGEKLEDEELLKAIDDGTIDVLVQSDWQQSRVKQHLVSLSPFLTRDRVKLDQEAFTEELNAFLGDTYQLPVVVTEAKLVAYNKTIFDDLGIEPPNRGWTWNDLILRANKIENASELYGAITQSFSPSFLWALIAAQYDSDRMNASYTSLKESLATSLSVVNSPAFHTVPMVAFSVPNSRELFQRSGKMYSYRTRSGMFITTADGVSSIMRGMHRMGYEIGIAPLPSPKANMSYNLPTDAITTVSIASTSNHIYEAWQLVKLLVTPEGAYDIASAGVMPSNLSEGPVKRWAGAIGIDDTSAYKAFSDTQFTFFLGNPGNPLSTGITLKLIDNMEQILDGKIDADTAIENVLVYKEQLNSRFNK